jgi:hypothetical protein
MKSREASVEVQVGLAWRQLPVGWRQEHDSLALKGLWTQKVSGLEGIRSECSRQKTEGRVEETECAVERRVN